MKLRRSWYDALVAVRRDGPSAWVSGVIGRVGGARGRMFSRMIVCGYVTRPPYKVTPTGEKYILICERNYPKWSNYA